MFSLTFSSPTHYKKTTFLALERIIFQQLQCWRWLKFWINKGPPNKSLLWSFFFFPLHDLLGSDSIKVPHLLILPQSAFFFTQIPHLFLLTSLSNHLRKTSHHDLDLKFTGKSPHRHPRKQKVFKKHVYVHGRCKT